MRRAFGRLRRDERGVVAVEFALWSIFIFAVLLVGFDFGIYSVQRARLAKSVSEASNFAFASRKTIDVAEVRQYITASTELPGTQPVVTVTCNVDAACVNENRTCACLSTAGVLTTAGCGVVCPSGAQSGFYLTIRATYRYQAPVLPNSLLDGKTMTEVSTVQLQ